MPENHREKNRRLLEVRKSLKMTQSEMAALLGINRANLSRIENLEDNRNVPKDTSYILEKEKGVNPVWLETGEGEMFIKKEQKFYSEFPVYGSELMVGEKPSVDYGNSSLKEKLLQAYEKNIQLLEEISSLKDEILSLERRRFAKEKNVSKDPVQLP